MRHFPDPLQCFIFQLTMITSKNCVIRNFRQLIPYLIDKTQFEVRNFIKSKYIIFISCNNTLYLSLTAEIGENYF